MLFSYEAVDTKGNTTHGNVEAVTEDIAISSLQRRNLTIVSIESSEKKRSVLDVVIFEHVRNREIVVLSRQIATLFESQVSALRVFRLLASESTNPKLRRVLLAVADDIQGGSAISAALGKHPAVFSDFYVNLVRSGEEAGKLDQSFNYLADHLERMYEVTSKARNALVYPAFVVVTFVVVMVLMFVVVIPRISEVLLEVGGEIPFLTRVIIGISSFLINYGAFLLIALVVGGFFLWRYSLTSKGSLALSRFKLNFPFVGTLYVKLYLSRIADNLNTMLASGVPVIRALEVTASVVGDALYEQHLREAISSVRGGRSVSESLGKYPEFPGIVIQMIKVGEETGELGKILDTLARFYRREVTNTVDTLVNLIEPIMIVLLALMVGVLLSAVLLPIYNISSAL